MAKGKKTKSERDSNNSVIATNRQARRNFEILDTFEAGIVLKGSEVKSLREAQATIGEAFARVEDGELFLVNMHINPYSKATADMFSHEPTRKRKLLMHRREIQKLGSRMDQQRLTLVPMSMYFLNGNVKLELGLAKGKNVVDRRETIAKRDADRDADREIARARRRE